MTPKTRIVFMLVLLSLMTACNRSPDTAKEAGADKAAEPVDEHGHAEGEAAHQHTEAKDEHGHEEEEAGHADEHGHSEGEPKGEEGHAEGGEPDQIHLSDAQIRTARIEVAAVGAGNGGALTVPALIVADPTRSAVVAASIGGRVRALPRNVGEAVKKGDTLVVLESREAAELTAELAAAREQLSLANSTLQREERLFRERVSPEGDVLAARTAAKEAQIRVRLAQGRLGASGGAPSGDANSLALRSPIAGHVTSRSAQLGAMVATDAELFRVADLSTVALELSLLPDGAAQVKAGGPVSVISGGREGTGKIAFISPVIDPQTRQVKATALLPNRDGAWRLGETVEVSVPLATTSASGALTVPKTAIQTVEGKPSVFVRNGEGFRTVHVTLGPSSGNAVTVTSGLKSGDRIAITNTFVLKAEAGKGEGGHHDH